MLDRTEGFLGAGASGFDGSVFSQFMIQLQGVVIIRLWTLVFSWIALRVTSLITNLRVSNEDEDEGLDFGEHNESAYHSN